MYRKKGRGWTKHIDFMLIDIASIFIAFFISYVIRFGFNNPYAVSYTHLLRSGLSGAGDSLMIIIIDEASAKLASFYSHDEMFKLQWRSVAGKASMSEELQEKLYGAPVSYTHLDVYKRQREMRDTTRRNKKECTERKAEAGQSI